MVEDAIPAPVVPADEQPVRVGVMIRPLMAHEQLGAFALTIWSAYLRGNSFELVN